MKNNLFHLSIILLVGIFLIGISSAVSNSSATSFCCEKTNAGAWCQNAPESDCNSAYKKTPSSCEATSFCKMGCCYNSQEGNCVENSPQKICEEESGVWADSANCEIGQCQLGCCLIGDQAAFVTQTRCKRLANLYGLNIDYRTDIGNEFDCIASISSDVKGACVYEKDYQKECTFISQKECKALGESNVTFYSGRLCSDEKLGTTCAPTTKTTCVDGKDQVYFVDSCGNVANVYDASKVNDKDYWAKVYDVSTSCGYGKSNANSASCGNCDYYYGSTCKAYTRGQDKTTPLVGDNLCRDLSCTYQGKTYQHGETWCDSQGGTDKNLPGSRYFRLMCYNAEVIVEPCADFRQETCIQNEVNGFKSAACRVNRWQDCFLQTEKADCENGDRRDCTWISGVSVKINSSMNSNVCVPKFAPGFDFWNTAGDATKICGSASTQCVVTFDKSLLGTKTCKDNCDCLTSSWENSMANMCTSLGDCGNKVNFVGQAGFKQKSYITTVENSS